MSKSHSCLVSSTAGIIKPCLRSAALCLSALGLFAPAVSAAAPITYTINFVVNQQPVSGGLPTASFTYDSVTSVFTNFIVNWDGLIFNSTSAANNGPTRNGDSCGIPGTAAGSFAILSGTLSTCPITRNWIAVNSAASNIVAFNFGTQNNAATNYAILFNNPPHITGTPDASSGGTFTITAVPEAGTALMSAVGLLATGLFVRRKLMQRLS